MAISLILVFYCVLLCSIDSTDGGILSVTYPGIGTFHISDFYDPVYRPIELLPRSPENLDLKFALFTRRNHYTRQFLRINDIKSLLQSNFNSSLKTKIIVPGDSPFRVTDDYIYKMKDNFLTMDNYNVILAEYYGSTIAAIPYLQTVADIRVMGIMLGILIEDLCRTFGVSEESFHLIGHSLGAHFVAYTGKYLKGRLGHITGLDPAGPYFQGVHNTSARLWHTDARFVDVVHTNGAPFIPYLGFGMWETCGHVDIYVNGGERQLGCRINEGPNRIISQGIVGLGLIIICDHVRAAELYNEAILPTRSVPVAYLCEDNDKFETGACLRCSENSTNCVTLRPNLNEKVKDPEFSIGKRYFMNTFQKEPYFRFQYLVLIKMLNDTKNFEGLYPVLKSIKLKFIGKDGNNQDIYFMHKGEINRNYELSRVLALDTDPDGLMYIQFRWSRGIDLIHTKMNVEHLKITALSYKRDLRPPKTWIFYPVVKGIPNDIWMTFSKDIPEYNQI